MINLAVDETFQITFCTALQNFHLYETIQDLTYLSNILATKNAISNCTESQAFLSDSNYAVLKAFSV